jgi:ABC-type multidrug transport system fused ATPase/permease subunit
MKSILNILFSIPGFRLWLAVLVLSVIIADGLAIQALPLINREITALIERSIKGESIGLSDMYLLIGLAVGAMIVYMLFARISYATAKFLDYKLEKDIFIQGFTKLLYHDLTYVVRDKSSGLLNKVIRAANRVSGLFTTSLSALMRNVTRAIISLSIVTIIYWQATAVMLLIFIVYVAIYWLRYKKDVPYAEVEDKLFDKEFARVWEVIPQLTLTKIFTNEQKEIRTATSIYDRAIDITIKRESFWHYAGAAELVFIQLPVVMLQLWIGYQAILGVISLPNFVLLFFLIRTTMEPLYVLSWFMWEFQDAVDRAKAYLKILASKEQIKEPAHPKHVSNPYGDIVFHDVGFRYEKSKQDVLNGMNITFKGKQVSALVGKSGVGKTTITNLICRFFDVTGGAITYDGIDLRDMHTQDLRQHIGFVLQESFIFSGSVADNLRYAKENATKNEIIEALKKAHAWEFVKDFPKGIETEIGERGVKLSGGQRQRIAIARTILKDAPILILDEATNALDSESEKYVQESLEQFMEGRTVIIVAHRLSTLRKADTIFVLDHEGVHESGSHEELLQKDGIYKMLYDIQAGGFEQQAKIMKEYEMD